MTAVRLLEDLEALAAFSDVPAPAVTRVLYTPTDMAARAWLRGRCLHEGLRVREDAIGNLFARWEGSDPALPAIATGSHCDAIPSSGRYDGTVGVLGGLEAIRRLKEAGFQPRRSIELIGFTAEEPTRFGIGCLGSRAMAGSLSADALRALRDGRGEGFEAVRSAAGFAGSLESVKLPAGHYGAFVELHIEQGPLLEAAGEVIGIVEAIAAPASLRMQFTGVGGHAGAVLMPERRDAFLAAAETALAVEAIATSTGSPDTVGTTGVCLVFPGAINSIPSRTTLEIDIRDIDLESRDIAVRGVILSAEEVAMRRGIQLEVTMINSDPPAVCASDILDTIKGIVMASNLPFRRMVSRAYHDSLFMARIAPTAMIFIPCRGGVSHRPDEYASPEHLEAGVQILAETLSTLSL